MDKVDGDDAAGLRGQQLLPRRAGAAGRGADPGIVQDRPTVEAAIGRAISKPLPMTSPPNIVTASGP